MNVYGSKFSAGGGKLRYDGMRHGMSLDSYVCLTMTNVCGRPLNPGDIIRLKKIIHGDVCLKASIVRSR
jgi:hypothetical protein